MQSANKVGWCAAGQGKPNKVLVGSAEPHHESPLCLSGEHKSFQCHSIEFKKNKKGQMKRKTGQLLWGQLASAGLKVHRHREALQAGSYSVCLLPGINRKDSYSFSGALGPAFLFPTHCFIQKRQNALPSTSVRDLGPIISSILLDGTSRRLNICARCFRRPHPQRNFSAKMEVFQTVAT